MLYLNPLLDLKSLVLWLTDYVLILNVMSLFYGMEVRIEVVIYSLPKLTWMNREQSVQSRVFYQMLGVDVFLNS